MDRKIFSVDRIEGELAVCISDDDEVVVVKRSVLGDLRARDIFSARVDGDSLLDIIPDPCERDRRIEENRARAHALARKTKNKF